MTRVSSIPFLLAVVTCTFAEPAAEAVNSQPSWRSAVNELETLRDDTSAALTEALAKLLERARAAGEKDLVVRLLDTLPETLPRGYGVLPEITDEPSRHTNALIETHYSIETLMGQAEQRADAAETLAARRAADPESYLEALVTEYENQHERLQDLDERISYHAYWQAAVVDYAAYFEGRNRIVPLVRELMEARDSGENAERVDALQSEVLTKVAPFSPTKGLAIRTRRDGTHVLPVTVLTDITEKKFLKQFRAAVTESFSRSPVARALSFEVDLEIRRVSPTDLYPEGPPSKGEAIDLDAHVARFPKGAMYLTTGTESTHSWQGRSILLGPAPIHRNSLAHEFGHLLGFSDAYLRGFEGDPDDPYGVVLVEWSGLLDDLMGNSETGAVSETMILTLLKAYGPPGTVPDLSGIHDFSLRHFMHSSG